MELQVENQARGTRILFGDLARRRRELLNKLIDYAEWNGFEEIVLPSLEQAVIYEDKAGREVLNQMYTFPDRKGRELCLRPEGTATCQLLANGQLSRKGEVGLWYETRCWRYERPQAGRYREFTQFGMEILNPKDWDYGGMVELASALMVSIVPDCVINRKVQRGLGYYTEEGFEILCPQLGAQQQVLGGGKYKEGFGFAIGLDRLLLALEK